MAQHSLLNLILLTLGLGLGTFIQILDTSIANVSIPNISGDLGVSPSVGTWVITSFAISNAIVLPLTGWLSSIFGQVRLFIWSTALFSLASFLCAVAWTFEMLVIFRIIQGAVAGCLIPLSQGLLLNNYPPEQKGLAIGFWAMIVIVAPVVGPILGGYLTDNYGWPWIFYINVPIGIISCFLVWKTLENEKLGERIPIDYVGLILLVIGVAFLQITLDKGQELDWFSSSFIQTTATLSAFGFLYFCIWNFYSKIPVVNFSFFTKRNYTISLVVCSLGFLIFFGTTVILPLWLQTWQGYTAFKAGETVTPIGILPLLLSPFIGKFLSDIDQRWLVTFSFLMFGITFFWLSGMNPQVPINHIILIRFVQGLGLAFFFIPLINIALSDIEYKDISSSSGIYHFIRLTLGGGFGTSIFVTLWQRREIYHRSVLVENLTPFNASFERAIDVAENLGFKDGQTLAFIERTLQQQSYLLAVNDCFWVSGWIYFLLIPLIWISRPIKSKEKLIMAAE
jgi:DHA2 family multidrug resistance protein